MRRPRRRRRSAARRLANLIIGTPGPDHIVAGAGNDLVQAAFGGTDSVDCGAGVDIVSADAGDKVASNCEIVSRRLSVDPYKNTDSQHETAVEPDSVAWGDTVVAVFQIGRRAGGAAANIGTAVSHDDGRTWTRAFLPGTTVNASPPGPELAASDPSVAYDSVHGVWIVSTLTLEGATRSHIYIARSADGVHWSAPVDAADGPILDKEWITCDNGTSSPFQGRCYLEYTDDQKNIIVSQFSTDGGVTWSAPVRAGAVLVGTQPVVQPNGTLVVVAGDYRDERALSGSMIALSLDRRWRDVHALHRLRPAGRGQHADARDLAAVGRGRLERDDLRDVVRLPVPPRLLAERSRALDVDGRHDLDGARADDLRRRTRSSPALQPIRRIPAGLRSCTPTTTERARRAPCLLGMSIVQSRTAARPGAHRSGSTHSRSRPTGCRARKAAAWSATTSRRRTPARASCRCSLSRQRR